MLDKILAKPWTVDGQTFSARIWGDRNKLVDTIQQELTRLLVTGSATPDKAIAAIASKFKTAKENAGRLVMTESSYFSSIGQRDCYKELDVEQYQVVGTLDNGTCDKCSELDGKVFPMSAYQPGLTANPFHPWCRCCTAPYFADMEGVGERYARDIETGKAYAVSRNMTYEQWKDNQVYRMRANLPKGYVDRRKVGNPISSEQLRLFAGKANQYGVKLSENLGGYGGFENYCGDPSVLDDVLERVKNNASGLTKHSKYDTIILRYTDILDASGRIDTETFAMVKGRTITLNRFMYDDTEYIQSEYAKLVAEGFFASGTDYRNVIDHEMGHIFAKYDKNAVSKVRNIVTELSQNADACYDEYVADHISAYSLYRDEIIAELNAMRHGSKSALADYIWKEAFER